MVERPNPQPKTSASTRFVFSCMAETCPSRGSLLGTGLGWDLDHFIIPSALLLEVKHTLSRDMPGCLIPDEVRAQGTGHRGTVRPIDQSESVIVRFLLDFSPLT